MDQQASLQRSIVHFRETLRQHQLPVTVQRQAVFEFLITRRDHPTADQIYAAVRKRWSGISLMSIYRVLSKLVELGLIAKTVHQGSVVHFDPNTAPHAHMVCLECDSILDVDDKAWNCIFPSYPMQNEFEIKDMQIYFRGWCAKCRRPLKQSHRPKEASFDFVKKIKE